MQAIIPPCVFKPKHVLWGLTVTQGQGRRGSKVKVKQAAAVTLTLEESHDPSTCPVLFAAWPKHYPSHALLALIG